MAQLGQLEALIQPIVEALNCELWGVEYVSQGRHSQLRIFIDRSGGVSIDDCEKVSRQVSSMLDVEDPIRGEYNLEVSSPGMDRTLFKLDQYSSYVGHTLDIRLRSPYEGRRKFQGVLNAIENSDEVIIRVDDHELILPFEMIEKAKIVPKF